MAVLTIPDDGLFELGIYYQLDNQIAINRRMYRWLANVGTNDTNSTRVNAGLLAAGLVAALAPLLANAAKVLGTSIKLVPNPDRLAVSYDTTNSIDGSGGAVALPTQTAGLIRFTSPIMGKHGEGRNYLPFPPAAKSELHGVPTSAYKTELAAVASILGNGITVLDVPGNPGTIVPTLRPTPGVPPDPATITGHVTLGAWATQRRRGAFGRLNVSPFGP